MSPGPPQRLVDRMPATQPQRLLADLVPPPRFAAVRFDSYLPEPTQPSQAAALTRLATFVQRLHAPVRPVRRLLARPSTRAGEPAGLSGVYLDGGFGVGKTHLLASAWHAAPSPKSFTTFVELTHLVGAVGFAAAVELLGQSRLLCIDEFELDDPGDTVLVSSLLTRLVERGVRVAATSNTLPDRLGEGRFAASDFVREIQGLARHFQVVRIDGEDYRHRGLPAAPPALSATQLAQRAQQVGSRASLDDFHELLAHLARVHPSRYGVLVQDVAAVFIGDVQPLSDQVSALRLVVLADRLYDREIPVTASGVTLDRVFSDELLRGGYRKKYRRAASRLVALAHEAARRPAPAP